MVAVYAISAWVVFSFPFGIAVGRIIRNARDGF